jgi:REP element-mobilizing transposase RayT
MSSLAEIYLHFVWATAQRRPLLVPGVIDSVHDSVRRSCAALGCEPLAVGGMADHVHLLVRMRTAIAPSVLAQKVKGASSYHANPGHGGRAKLRWQGGYGVFSVSRRGIKILTRYIDNQERHHARGTIIPLLERTSDDPP